MIGNATELFYIFKCEQRLLNWNWFCLISRLSLILKSSDVSGESVHWYRPAGACVA